MLLLLCCVCVLFWGKTTYACNSTRVSSRQFWSNIVFLFFCIWMNNKEISRGKIVNNKHIGNVTSTTNVRWVYDACCGWHCDREHVTLMNFLNLEKAHCDFCSYFSHPLCAQCPPGSSAVVIEAIEGSMLTIIDIKDKSWMWQILTIRWCKVLVRIGSQFQLVHLHGERTILCKLMIFNGSCIFDMSNSNNTIRPTNVHANDVKAIID